MSVKKIIYWLLVLGITLIILSYFFIDLRVERWAITHPRGSSIFDISEFISHFGESTYPLIVSALLWLFWKFWKKSQELASKAGFFFLSIVITGLASNILKLIFGKARPLLLKDHEEFGFSWLVLPSDYVHQSFPSGHTTTAFTIATALTLMFPRWWPLFYGYAVMEGLSRIGVWFHYPSDVMAGALLGTTLTLLLYQWPKISFKKSKKTL